MAAKLTVALALLLAFAMIATAQSCPPGYSSVNGQCVLNCQAANCDVCDPYDETHTACSTCSFGFIITPSKTCTPACSVPNCKLCSSSGNNACQECAPGYLRTAPGMCKRGRNGATTAASAAVAAVVIAASVYVVTA
ncbi:hypothetical protein NESM_000115900 [Novymonas esmeraldas]|uniref:Surface antigen-like protein n=1 Tax=Novymonas esmeraldas TaxID=1808958 RepID=A0AAW0F4L1_9TRYP